MRPDSAWIDASGRVSISPERHLGRKPRTTDERIDANQRTLRPQWLRNIILKTITTPLPRYAFDDRAATFRQCVLGETY
jgi:hypothetical protein